MSDLSFVILYVSDVARAQKLYADLLSKPALEASPGFAMFPAAPGVMLGLWRADEVQPKATAPGGAEFCLTAENAAAVKATAEVWRANGIVIAQEPTRMDFGFTFVGLDPDGHRLRVFAPL